VAVFWPSCQLKPKTQSLSGHLVEPEALPTRRRRNPQPRNGLAFGGTLSANMSETVAPWKFSVEGESGLESDERIGAGPRWASD
jgi:hypothetical protein